MFNQSIVMQTRAQETEFRESAWRKERLVLQKLLKEARKALYAKAATITLAAERGFVRPSTTHDGIIVVSITCGTVQSVISFH